MKVLRIVLVVFSLVLAGAAQNAVADDTAKHNDIVRLLKVTGTLNIADQMAVATYQQFAQMIKQTNPKIPDRALKAVEEETVAFMRELIPGLMNQMVPLYSQNFSHDEIKQLIAFYETDVGRKAVSLMPQMMQQSMAITQQHMQQHVPQLQQRIEQRLQSEGIK